MSAPRPPEFPQREDLSPYWQTRVLGAAILIAALAVVVWQAYVSVSESQEEVVIDAPGQAAAAKPAMPRTFPQAPRRVVAAASAPPLAPDESDVCGIGHMKTAEVERDPRFLAAWRRGNVATWRSLAASPQEIGRATGLALRSFAQEPNANCQGADCILGVPAAGAADAREALARIAVGTGSPAVYALALRACGPQRVDGNCAMLSIEQWTRLDAENAVPWLVAAATAAERGDVSTVDEAMFRASRAQKIDSGQSAWLAATAQNMPSSLLPLERSLVLMDAYSQFSANLALTGAAAGSTLSKYCSVEAVRNANRLQLCAGLADTLARKGETQLDLALAAAIGARVGWPAERVEALRQERDAMYQVSLSAVSDASSFFGCESLERKSRYFTDVAAFGEVEGLRRAIRNSGLSTESLAREYRAAMNSASAVR